MIPKECLLTNKDKLRATLTGMCNVTQIFCKNCPYANEWNAYKKEMEEAMKKWTAELLLGETNSVKIK